jgi:hypothetical protein
MKRITSVLKHILLIALVATVSILPAQEGDSPTTEEQSQAQVNNLAREVELLKSGNEVALQKFELKASSILEEKKQAMVDETNKLKSTTYIWLGLLTVLGLASIGTVWSIRGKVETEVETQMKSKMDDLIQDKQSYFLNLIQNQEVETLIQQKEKLLVLSKGANDQQNIMSVISDFNIPAGNVIYKTLPLVAEDKKELLNGSRIVLINNQSSIFNNEEVQNIYAEASSNTLFLGYTTAQLPRHERASFANSKYTLYNNLIQLAKYRRMTGKNLPS